MKIQQKWCHDKKNLEIKDTRREVHNKKKFPKTQEKYNKNNFTHSNLIWKICSAENAKALCTISASKEKINF